MELSKSQIKLVDEAMKLVDDIKKAEARVNEIKESLASLQKGTYLTRKAILTVTMRNTYDGPTPAILLLKLKEMKLKDRFIDCVKVQTTETKKIIGEERFNALQTLKQTMAVFSFKKRVE